MELVLSVVATLVAVVAVALAWTLRTQVAQLARGHSGAELARLRHDSGAELAQLRHDSGVELEQLRQALIDLRRDLDHAQRELEELKAATQVVPAPPLPRARSTGLSDLREQLRAAHRESEPGTDE
ncbi:MAG TPA: hypothetical protein VKV73_08890 [Chloroflexota bacterium]|nr:hypothetical protein [Chloroflexota bacterium]